MCVSIDEAIRDLTEWHTICLLPDKVRYNGLDEVREIVHKSDRQ